MPHELGQGQEAPQSSQGDIQQFISQLPPDSRDTLRVAMTEFLGITTQILQEKTPDFLKALGDLASKSQEGGGEGAPAGAAPQPAAKQAAPTGMNIPEEAVRLHGSKFFESKIAQAQEAGSAAEAPPQVVSSPGGLGAKPAAAPSRNREQLKQGAVIS